jgi:hypothetical protein
VNLLKHEYEDNLLRTKMRDRRRKWVIGGAQIGATVAFGLWLAFELEVAWSLVGVAVYFGAQGFGLVRRWIADRGVESSSTEREQVDDDDGPQRVRHTIAILGVVVACALLKIAPPVALVAIVLACALAMLGVAVMKLRETVVEREERSPDSADTCEIRTRKWTK